MAITRNGCPFYSLSLSLLFFPDWSFGVLIINWPAKDSYELDSSIESRELQTTLHSTHPTIGKHVIFNVTKYKSNHIERSTLTKNCNRKMKSLNRWIYMGEQFLQNFSYCIIPTQLTPLYISV